MKLNDQKYAQGFWIRCYPHQAIHSKVLNVNMLVNAEIFSLAKRYLYFNLMLNYFLNKTTNQILKITESFKKYLLLWYFLASHLLQLRLCMDYIPDFHTVVSCLYTNIIHLISLWYAFVMCLCWVCAIVCAMHGQFEDVTLIIVYNDLLSALVRRKK